MTIAATLLLADESHQVRRQAVEKVEADEPQRFIVVLKGQGAAAAVARRHTLKREHVYSHAIRGFSVRMNRAERRRLAADPLVALIEADVRVRSCSQTIPTGVRRILATENTYARIDGVDGDGALTLTWPLLIAASIWIIRI